MNFFIKIIKKIFFIIKDCFKNKFPIIYYKLLLLRSFVLNNVTINDILIKKIILNNKFKQINYKRNNKKKIILVIGNLTHGGAERQILRLAELLVQKNYNVKVASLIHGGKKLKYKINKKIKIDFIQTKVSKKYYLNHPLYLWIKNLSFFNLYEKLHFLKLYDYLKKENPNCTHAFLDFYSIISGFIGIILNTPKIILSARNVSPNNFVFYRSYFKECYKYLSKYNNITFINNSIAGCNSYNKWLKLKKNKFKVINNIYDFNKKIKIHPINVKRENSINIGSIMRLDPEKNPMYYLGLAKFIITKNKNYYFYLMGEGALKDKVKKFIKKYNLSKNVLLLKNTNNVYDYLHFFDLFLLTSDYEGTPNVVLESQHVGTPVIFKNAGGTAEALIKNYTGYLLNKNSFIDDYKIIKKLVGKKNFLIKRDIKKIKRKLDKFLPVNSLKKTLDIYNG